MGIDVRKQGEVHVLKPHGRLVLGQGVDEMRSTVTELMQQGFSEFAVNLSDVPMMDSSGIGVLVRLQTTAKQADGALKLVKPVDLVLKTLKLVGLLSVFEVFDDDASAVGSFGGEVEAVRA